MPDLNLQYNTSSFGRTRELTNLINEKGSSERGGYHVIKNQQEAFQLALASLGADQSSNYRTTGLLLQIASLNDVDFKKISQQFNENVGGQIAGITTDDINIFATKGDRGRNQLINADDFQAVGITLNNRAFSLDELLKNAGRGVLSPELLNC